MSEQEQNKKINELNRRLTRLESLVKGLDLDLEPNGRIAKSFEAIERHLEKRDRRFDRLEYNQNQANGKLDGILDRLTGLSDLPEN